MYFSNLQYIPVHVFNQEVTISISHYTCIWCIAATLTTGVIILRRCMNMLTKEQTEDTFMLNCSINYSCTNLLTRELTEDGCDVTVV